MNILQRIAQKTRERIEDERRILPLPELRCMAERRARKPFSFAYALQQKGRLAVIAEVKKASPSLGVIDESFDYLSIAKTYEEAGADAVSCLTEPYWFLGKDAYLEEISDKISIPVLRKDFTIDEYMVYQAGAFGADAVLLIVSLLSDGELSDYLSLSEELGLSALTECHDENEIERALGAGAKIIGINNRDLTTFSTDTAVTGTLSSLVPDSITLVSESGIKSAADAQKAAASGADAILVGEALMKASDRKRMLESLRVDR